MKQEKHMIQPDSTIRTYDSPRGKPTACDGLRGQSGRAVRRRRAMNRRPKKYCTGVRASMAATPAKAEGTVSFQDRSTVLGRPGCVPHGHLCSTVLCAHA